MYLKSVLGGVLFEGRFYTVKHAVEAAVKDGVCLDNVDLRHANLKGVLLDGASLKGACLWGASLDGAGLTGVSLQGSDCRNANFKDCCLAESYCDCVDFSGSYFSRTIIGDADLSNTKFSCPSLFNLNLSEAKTIKGAIYSHKGEVDCDLSDVPISICGLPKNIVLMKDKMLIGHSLYNIDMRDYIFSGFQEVIDREKTFIIELVKEELLQNVKNTSQKIVA